MRLHIKKPPFNKDLTLRKKEKNILVVQFYMKYFIKEQFLPTKLIALETFLSDLFLLISEWQFRSRAGEPGKHNFLMW